MSLILPARAIERTQLEIGLGSDGSQIANPSTTFTKLTGTTSVKAVVGDGLTSEATWRLNAAQAGRYEVECGIFWTATEDDVIDFALGENGSAPTVALVSAKAPSTGDPGFVHLRAVLELAATDYVEPFLASAASATQDVTPLTGSWMRARRLPDAGGLSAPIDNDWDTFLDADAGPVGTPSTAVGNDITDWIALAGANYDQTSGAVRGVLDNTTFSDGRLSVLFAASDFMRAVAGMVVGTFDGVDVPYLRYTHLYIVTSTGLAPLAAFGDDSSTANFDLLRIGSSTTSVRVQRSASANAESANGILGVGEYKIVEIFYGTTKSVWVNGTLRINTAAWNPSDSPAIDNATIAGWFGNGILQAGSHIAVRHHGIRRTWTGDGSAEAATLSAIT